MKITMSGRKIEQLLIFFSVDYFGLEVCDNGPIMDTSYTKFLKSYLSRSDINLS